MEYDTTKELYVVVDHLPFQVIAAGCPVVVIDSLVTIDGDEVLARIGCQLTVEVGSGDDSLLVLGKATCCLLDDGEDLRHHLVEGLLIDVEHLFLQLVNLGEDVGTLVDRCLLDGSLQFLYLLLLLVGRVLHLVLYVLRTLTKCVVVELLYLRVNGLHLLYERLDELHVT